MPKVNQLGHATDVTGELHPTHQSDEINDGRDIDIVPQPGNVDPHRPVNPELEGDPVEDAEEAKPSVPNSSSTSSEPDNETLKSKRPNPHKAVPTTARRSKE